MIQNILDEWDTYVCMYKYTCVFDNVFVCVYVRTSLIVLL